MNRPPDYDAYWQRVDRELAALPMAAEEEMLPIRCTDGADCYTVRLTSIGPYRLFAYLSVPRGKGPFPALYQVPRLMSVVEVLTQGTPQALRERFVTFSLAFRGQRNADQPYAAAFPGLLTDGIEDPERYAFRGIVADLIRGLEYLLTRPEVDRGRVVAVAGHDLVLLLAGLRAGVTHLVTNLGPFYDARASAASTAEYPLEEINDYLRQYPDREEQLFATTSYFDPFPLAEKISARSLIWCGSEGSAHGLEWVRPVAERLSGAVDVRASRQSSYQDGKFQEDWISRQLGFAEPVYPEAWARAPRNGAEMSR